MLFNYVVVLFVGVVVAAGETLTSRQAGNGYDKFTQFLNKLSIKNGSELVIRQTTGDSIVSEGQGYGLLIGGVTVATLRNQPGSENEFDTAIDKTVGLFNGWKRMCQLSKWSRPNSLGCDMGNSVCFPDWNFDLGLSQSLGTGFATDADEDAIVGMILLVLATQDKKDSYPWWNEIAHWTFDSVQSFMTWHADSSKLDQGWIMLNLGLFGGWDCTNPSYHAPGAYKLFRDFSRSFAFLSRTAHDNDKETMRWNMLIRTSYAILLGSQCAENGLVPNWYTPASIPYNQGTVECEYSYQPGPEFGEEAFRTIWRVVLDSIWYPGDTSVDTMFADYGEFSAEEFLAINVRTLREQYQEDNEATFAYDFDLSNSCVVTSVFKNISAQPRYYSTLASALTYATGGELSSQQSELDAFARRMNEDLSNNTDYYDIAWLTISSLTINGDLLSLREMLPTSLSNVTESTVKPERSLYLQLWLVPLLMLIWVFVAWCLRAHLFVRRCHVVLALASGGYYLGYRTYAFVKYDSDIWASSIVLGLEFLLFTGMIQPFIVLWYDKGHIAPKRLTDLPIKPYDYPSVDVMIPCYTEPVDVVRGTVIAALHLDYPHQKLNVYLCDDGSRSEVADIVSDLLIKNEGKSGQPGLHYVARVKTPGVPHHAKAGNINNCLLNVNSTGEYVVIFDCDMICKPEFLHAVLPHFYEEPIDGECAVNKKMCMVQTPQTFYNIAPRDHLNQHMLGQSAHVMEALREMGAVPCCGTNVALKRSALEEVGGIQYGSITEDFLTSMAMQSRGYETTYVYELLAEGMAPDTLKAFYTQRCRWAGGGLEIFFNFNPMFYKGQMTFKQRLMYFLGGYSSLLNVPTLLLLCLLLTFTSITLYSSTRVVVIGGHWAEVLCAFGTYVIAVVGCFRLSFRTGGWTAAIGVMQQMAYFVFWQTPLVFQAMRGKKLRFKVTSKDGESQRMSDLRLVVSHILFTILALTLLCTIIVELVEGNPDTGLLVFSLCWMFVLVLQLLPPIEVALFNPMQGYSNRTLTTPYEDESCMVEKKSFVFDQFAMPETGEKEESVSFPSTII
eukprot:CAMPEP_0203764924 /NCGR_PEP_ID=MMETSP0098-20131031/18130_1 /ASSEMBLY_ACC=CAM_ASM_000208 /TAXON_ID=96639 /ORGANISM=" , Strain NY0313808BC1" /LENGTH=1065 /DNA_ID=CAMNT_0050661127 /DNA_START=2126 /DNA_END=5323 /DNA_ORIENTATION=-